MLSMYECTHYGCFTRTIYLPPFPHVPPSCHTEDNHTVVKGNDPMSLTNTSSIVNDQLQNLIESVNDKIKKLKHLKKIMLRLII